MQQYQTIVSGKSLELVRVGSYKDGNLTLMDNTSLWPSKRSLLILDVHYCNNLGGVPYDGSPVHVLVTVSLPLTVVYYLIATVGVVLAVACCVFNFTFRKRK